MVPCVIYEDEHLLVVHKPAGWNTHAPAPTAGEGIYDWLKPREPHWSSLAIIHRLDKETSGVMVFGKTPAANRSLTEQFAQRRVRKKYLLFTDRKIPAQPFTVHSSLVRTGEKYASRPGGEPAETRFTPVLDAKFNVQNCGLKMVYAEPLTGRTHQIRVHAAENGFPILGDTLYGGTASSRVYLHAESLALAHPVTGAPLQFTVPEDFATDPRQALRKAIIDPEVTNAFRLIHGAGDGWPGWYVEKLGPYLLSQSGEPLTERQREELMRLARLYASSGAYHKTLSRQVRQTAPADAAAQLVWGEAAPVPFEILENGVRYELSFAEGYSVGLFLDQRDNRRRILAGQVGRNFPLPRSNFQSNHELAPADGPSAGSSPEFLNVFAYTCGFSVCAAKAGMHTTSLDLSKKYLEWGRRNFALNGLTPEKHDFIYGDAFDWLRRLAKKGRAFDVVVLDPPTFSQSQEHGIFRVERDFGELVAAALRVLKPQGALLASANPASWPAEKFLATVTAAFAASPRAIVSQIYVPQPPDFPITRSEPAYLKTVWMR